MQQTLPRVQIGFWGTYGLGKASFARSLGLMREAKRRRDMEVHSGGLRGFSRRESLRSCLRQPADRNSFVQSAAAGFTMVEELVVVETHSGAAPIEPSSGGAVASGGGGDGDDGGGGDEGGDGDSDPEPPAGTVHRTVARPDHWWRTCLLIATAVVLALLPALPSAYHQLLPLIGLGAFAAASCLNPEFWYRRKAGAALAGWLACSTLANLNLDLDLGQNVLLGCRLDGPSWCFHPCIAFVICFYGWLDFRSRPH